MTNLKIGTKEAIMMVLAVVVCRSLLSLPRSLLISSKCRYTSNYICMDNL